MSRRIAVVVLVVGAVIAAFALWPRGAAPVEAPRPKVAGYTTVLRSFAQPAVQGRQIAGIVTLDGKPAAGAGVLLSDPLGRSRVVMTKADGRFDFGPQPAAMFAVVAEMPMRAPAVASIDLRDPRVASDDLHLVLHPCDASLRGTIRDAAGGTVPHARVALPLVTLGTTDGTEADDTGAYELCVPVGWSTIAIFADGYARTTEPIEAFGAVHRDFTLVPAATVAGRVLHARDRSPVANAIVELRPDAWQGFIATRATPLRVLTDEQGVFHIASVMPGPYAVTARADGLMSVRPAYVIAETGEAGDDVECLVDETRTVRGKVVEEGTRAPVAGVSIWLSSKHVQTRPSETLARTQNDGSFAIEVLPGAYEPIVQRRELRGETPRIDVTTKDAEITLVVGKGASIAGRVTRGGQPVEGTDVSLRGPSSFVVKTDHEGRYELTNVAPGEYRVYAESRRAGAFSPGPALTVAEGEQRTKVDIELELAGSVAGIVVDQDAKPVAGVFVRFSLLRGNDFGVATTAGDGSFHARAMSGGGDYVYEVRPSSSSQITFPPATGKRFPAVTVRDGTSAVTGLRIQIRREQLAIAGRVLDANGKPIAGARIAIAPSMYDGQPLVTDETGTFTAPGLPAGTYNLFASYAGREARAGNVAAGRTDVVLRFAQTGVIEGTLEGFAGEPDLLIYGPNGGVVRPAIAKRTFRVGNAEPGTYRITATSATTIAGAEVTVTAGATTEVGLQGGGVGTIAGTVVDEATRQPKSRVFCEAQASGPIAWVPPVDSRTDSQGNFRLERVPAGRVDVYCANGTATATVVAGETTRIEVVAKTQARKPIQRGSIGLELEDQLQEVRVKSVVAGGPAARAGILVGDVLVKVGDSDAQPYTADFVLAELEIGSVVKITVERGDKPLVFDVTVEAAP